MAYFDDPGKKASWEKQLDQLREERESRKTGSAPSKPRESSRIHSGRTPITFQQLQEKAFGKEKAPKRSSFASRQREHTMTKQAGGKGR